MVPRNITFVMINKRFRRRNNDERLAKRRHFVYAIQQVMAKALRGNPAALRWREL